MRLLLTSDTQSEFHTLDLCKTSMLELLAHAKKYRPDAVIHCGDAKEHYVHSDLVWVIKLWVWVVRMFIAEGFRFIILMGNHDRLSQSPDAKHWLDILRAAGAEVVSVPKWKKIGDGHVAFLPYTPDKKQEKQWAVELASDSRVKMTSALIFHTELQGAILNSSGTKSEGLSPKDLCIGKYAVAMGGHLHIHQKYYVGSPFCMDWNDVNQTKGHVLVDVINTGREIATNIKQLKTSIAGWYDSEWLQANKVKPEKGAHIRSRVPVTSKKITDQIRKEEQRLTKLYPGTNIFVVPKLEQAEDAEIKLDEVSDDDQVEKYVASTLKEGIRFKAKQLVRYLTTKLGAVIGSGQRKGRLRFIDFTGTNVLTYSTIKINYRKQGLVLLKGKNLDWPKQSNGAGKTNALSMVPIGMFGETLKEQKNDEWAREGTKDKAIGVLRLRDSRNRLLQIERERRKHAIRLIIDGDDKSAGLTGKEKTGTQGIIERETGFDLNLLLNSVYIDQTIANGFIFGKQAQRMKLIEKLCNLERFETAAKLVSADIKKSTAEEQVIATKLENAESDAERLLEDFTELQKHVETEWEKQRVTVEKQVKLLKRQHEAVSNSKQFYDDMQTEYDAVVSDITVLRDKVSIARGAITNFTDQRNRSKTLIDAGKCPRCGQPSEQVGNIAYKTAKKKLEEAEIAYVVLTDSSLKLLAKEQKLSKEIQRYKLEVANNKRDLEEARKLLAQAEHGAAEESKRNKKIEQRKQVLHIELKNSHRLIKAFRVRITDLAIDREMLEEAKHAFQRSGMPLYIASALCPLLNNAANEFAETFFQGKTRVQFEVLDGEFTPWVLNPNGSKTLKGQSVGEAAMAGIIAAFAVREAAPKTNLLIIDEPGHGLDPVGATQFAKGLLSLKEKYETIIVTTHSPYIEAVLSGEKTWTVEKQKGVSKLLTD